MNFKHNAEVRFIISKYDHCYTHHHLMVFKCIVIYVRCKIRSVSKWTGFMFLKGNRSKRFCTVDSVPNLASTLICWFIMTNQDTVPLLKYFSKFTGIANNKMVVLWKKLYAKKYSNEWIVIIINFYRNNSLVLTIAYPTLLLFS